MIAVVKVGTSSITDAEGDIDRLAISKIGGELAAIRAEGHEVVLVSSGAIACGLPALGLSARRRPRDMRTLQAASAVGQARLMQVYRDCFDALAVGPAAAVVPGQVLLAPTDFVNRRQYLHARSTLTRLLELGALPIVNENDAVADDEIRFGDNDRIAALVAQLIGAEVLVLLTDAAGVFTADPRLDEGASLIEEIVTVDAEMQAAAGGSGSNRGSGGMSTKLAAARIAAWSGVRTVIAAADRPSVITEAINDVAGVGTVVRARDQRLSARKVWIAFAVGSSGRISVDGGACTAVRERGSSLLAAGVVSVDGSFDVYDAVEICGPDGEPFAKGLVRVASGDIDPAAGLVIHRDDLVVLPD